MARPHVVDVGAGSAWRRPKVHLRDSKIGIAPNDDDAQACVDYDAETEDESVVEVRHKVTPTVIEDNTDQDLEYYMRLFQRNLHDLNQNIQNLEHDIHEFDRIVKQKITPVPKRHDT